MTVKTRRAGCRVICSCHLANIYFWELYFDFPLGNHPSLIHNHVVCVGANATSGARDGYAANLSIPLLWTLWSDWGWTYNPSCLWLKVLGDVVSLLPLLKDWCINLMFPEAILPSHRECWSMSDTTTQEGRVKADGDASLWTSFQHLDPVMPKARASPGLFSYTANRFSILLKWIWVGFFCHLQTPKTWFILGLHPDHSLWHTGHFGEDMGTPWEEQDVERIQPGLASLYPQKNVLVSWLQRLRLQWWIVSLLQKPLLWLWCPEQVFFQLQWSNSFKKQSNVISKSSKLGNQGYFIRHIYSIIKHLIGHPEASFKLLLLIPRQNSHAASQTLKIKWKSSCCAGWNLLSWKVPVSTPASW